MNDRQIAHFRAILLDWKHKLMEEVDRTLLHMQDDAANFPDPTIAPRRNRSSRSNFGPVIANASSSRRSTKPSRRWKAATTASAKRAGSRSASGASKRVRPPPCATTARSSTRSAKSREVERTPHMWALCAVSDRRAAFRLSGRGARKPPECPRARRTLARAHRGSRHAPQRPRRDRRDPARPGTSRDALGRRGGAAERAHRRLCGGARYSRLSRMDVRMRLLAP